MRSCLEADSRSKEAHTTALSFVYRQDDVPNKSDGRYPTKPAYFAKLPELFQLLCHLKHKKNGGGMARF
jgi:hypothetical protein